MEQRNRVITVMQQIDNLYSYAASGKTVEFMTILSRAINLNQQKRIQAKDALGYNYLHYASANGHLAIVQFLINSAEHAGVKFKLNINRLTMLNETAVLLAFKYNHFEIVAFLLEHGADSTIKDTNGLSCLYYAQFHNNQQLLQLIEEYSSSTSSTEEFDTSQSQIPRVNI
jgi:ankyrin repeat protein